MTLVLTFVDEWPQELKAVGERVFAAIVSELSDLPAGTINLKLVDDAEITRLNTQYNGNAYATDVLTFSYAEEGAVEGELADVVISTEMAKRQADEAGTSMADEIGLLITHGVLHALGYDHSAKADQDELNQLQRKIMEQSGLVYREFTWKP